MKFILHNLHMIWSRLRSNGWVLAELFLVFIVMWFLCDSLGCLKYTFYRPLGYSIDHVYQLNTIIGGATSDTTLTNADRYLRALRKLEQEPSVEAAALCYWSLPMSGNNSDNSLAAQDTIGVNARIILTTGGYIDVFRMSDDPQRPFAKTPAEPGSCGPFQEENADLLTGYTAELLWRYHVGRYARRKDRSLPQLSLRKRCLVVFLSSGRKPD